jgi:hypothetical protein
MWRREMFALSVLLIALSLQTLPSGKMDKPVIENNKTANKSSESEHSPSNEPSKGVLSRSESEPNTKTPESDGQTPPENRVYAIKIVSQPPDPWFRASVIIAAALVLLGFISLGLLWRQTKATEIAATAARDNAQALINSERALVDIAVIRQSTDSTLYDLKITNEGKTPAKLIHCEIGANSFPPGSPSFVAKEFTASYKSIAHAQIPTQIFLREGKDQVLSAVTDLARAFISWDEVKSGKQSGLIQFAISYQDIINRTNRATSSIFYFNHRTNELERIPGWDAYS